MVGYKGEWGRVVFKNLDPIFLYKMVTPNEEFYIGNMGLHRSSRLRGCVCVLYSWGGGG